MAQNSSRLGSLKYLRANDLDLLQWSIFTIGLDETHSLDNLHATLDSAENSMFPIQPRGWSQGDEELTAIGVFATVGHAQNAGAGMLERGVDLICELFAVDAGSAASGACWVARLNHEVWDDAVEDDVVVVPSLG